jgi:pseudouridine-5'-phosphate glycosidase
MSPYLEIKEEVAQALQNRQPVVALESTLIAHGMPYPQNLETARRVEQIVWENGATPATIAIISGRIKVGLSDTELAYIAQNEDILKVSRRDLPYAVSQKKNGATTVAATMIIAAMAGIRVFVTGGIGGVHREGESTLDISADLSELAQTNVAVVCAGAKAVLDIGRTLEYLETMGVPVIGLKTDDFPAFYARKSGFKTDYRIDTHEALAALIHTKWEMGLQGGVVVANPVPAEAAMEGHEIQVVIENALEEAKRHRIAGKAITPFLLEYIKQHTGGKSLTTNIALVCHNAQEGAKLSVALARKYQ